MGGVDEPLQAERAAVGGLGGAEVDAVVAPAARAGELGHGHQLDRRHAQLGSSPRYAIAPSKVPSGENVPMCSS